MFYDLFLDLIYLGDSLYDSSNTLTSLGIKDSVTIFVLKRPRKKIEGILYVSCVILFCSELAIALNFGILLCSIKETWAFKKRWKF